MSSGALGGFNVLIVSIDTVRADHVGCYGYAKAKTPVLDGLAQRGVRCAETVTNVPLTLPGHATLLTGLNPLNHGARLNVLYQVKDEVRTLAELLGEQGYRTGAVLSAFVLDRRFGLSQGFDDYDDELSESGRSQPSGYRERIAEETNKSVLAWLERHGTERFFLWVHYFDPHMPYSPPEPYASEFADSPYDGEIAYADAQLGRVIDVLEALGVRERTLIVATSDHGEGLGEHDELTHGLLLYDPTLLVPLIFSAPAPMPQGKVLHRQVGLVDVVPTVLDLLGLPIPEGLDGLSLLKPEPAPNRTIYIESLWCNAMHHWAPLAGLRRRDLKYIYAPRPELYDLEADPNETRNLYGERPEVARKLHASLTEHLGDDPEMRMSIQANIAIDDEAKERLAGLGYVVASSAPVTSRKTLPDPKDMMGEWARFERAMDYVQAGLHARGIELMEAYVRDHPDDLRALGQLAESALTMHESEKSAAAYKRYLELRPEDSGAMAGLALTRIQAGHLDEAKGLLMRALVLDAENTAALFGLGVIAGTRGEHDKAMRYFQECVAAGRGSRTAPAHFNIGVLHKLADRPKAARQSFEKALSLDPHHADSLHAMGGILKEEGRLDEAIRLLSRGIGRRTLPKCRKLLGELLAEKGRTRAAAKQFEIVLKQKPKDIAANYQYGLAKYELGDIDTAVTHFQTCVQEDPNHINARFHLGVSLAQKGRFEEAERHLRKVVDAAPEFASGWFNLGTLYVKRKAYGSARAAFAQAIRIEPNNAQAHSALGTVLLELGRRERAIAEFREALRIAPGLESARQSLHKATGQSK